MTQELHDITGIDKRALRGRSLSEFSIDERISWAADWKTKRKENAASSLLGMFGIHMPLIHGEGSEKIDSSAAKRD
jgi:hypothetical protein